MASQIEKTIIKIKQRIKDDPKIRDISHVTFSDQTKGAILKRHFIQAAGRVNTQEELDQINSIINDEAKGVKVVNTVRVQYRN